MNQCRECGAPIQEGVWCDACDPHWWGDKEEALPRPFLCADDNEGDDWSDDGDMGYTYWDKGEAA